MITTIQKLVFGGQGLGRTDDNKIIFAYNALPGEEVEIQIIKKKKDYIEGIAAKIIKPSPHRLEPKEDHFLSCSPWQILDFEQENFWKKEIALETYQKIGHVKIEENNTINATNAIVGVQNFEPLRDIEPLQDSKFPQNNIEIISNPAHQYHYRNKMEYSLTEDETGKISLAFHHRGGRQRIPAKGCLLAEEIIDETAKKIIDWINQVKIPIRSLKSIIIRSNNEGQSIAALFVKDELKFDSYPSLSDTLLGFQLYYSTHKCPASVPTKLLYSLGQNFLITHLNQTKLKFGLLSFFQVNIALFAKALNDIASFLDPRKEVIDYYSGVGAIGLPLHQQFKKGILVDNNEEAIKYAKENIELNGIKNCEAVLMEAEKITDLITSDKIIIFDPPRAGLHQDIIDKILKEKPLRILYLSCNLSTHARDLGLLQKDYQIKFFRLYNFFPRTPHVECLCVLDRIKP